MAGEMSASETKATGEQTQRAKKTWRRQCQRVFTFIWNVFWPQHRRHDEPQRQLVGVESGPLDCCTLSNFCPLKVKLKPKHCRWRAKFRLECLALSLIMSVNECWMSACECCVHMERCCCDCLRASWLAFEHLESCTCSDLQYANGEWGHTPNTKHQSTLDQLAGPRRRGAALAAN